MMPIALPSDERESPGLAAHPRVDDHLASVGATPAASREQIVRFGEDGALIGIATPPAAGQTAGRPAVVFISAGMVHRIGPNRMYVMLARRLAQHGFWSVRFDLSGIGDSENRKDGIPADQSAILETRLVMDALQRTLGIGSFVLGGLCSGAVTAFHTAVADSRVVGALMLNPQGFDHDPAWNAHVLNRAQARRYVKATMFSTERWRRALTGKIDYRRLTNVMMTRAAGALQQPAAISPVAERLQRAFGDLAARGTRLMVICCAGDSSIDYMSAILGRDAGRDQDDGPLAIRIFAASDHSMTALRSQQALSSLVENWASELAEPPS